MLTRGMQAALKGRMDGFVLEKVIAEARAFLEPGPRRFEETRQYLQALHPQANDRVLGHAVQAWTGLQALSAIVKTMPLDRFKDEQGHTLYDLPKAPLPGADAPAPVRFLPEYDSAIVARSDARLLAGKYRTAVFRPGLRVLATFLVDGAVAGTWSIERRKSAATLRLSPFVSLAKKARAELEEEAEMLLRFSEKDATVFAVSLAA